MDAALASRAQAAFELLGTTLFPAHGQRNIRLDVDVVDTGLAGTARTLVLILPWGFEGVIFDATKDGIDTGPFL